MKEVKEKEEAARIFMAEAGEEEAARNADADVETEAADGVEEKEYAQ